MTKVSGIPQQFAAHRLRSMTQEDLDTVVTIERCVYDFPWTYGIFRDCLLLHYSCWVCEDEEGKVVAYAIMAMGAEEAHLLNICVAPPFQGRGVGRRLLIHALKVARKHDTHTILLEVRPSNDTALRLYREMGFSVIGVRKAYYPAKDGKEDALVLSRSLV